MRFNPASIPPIWHWTILGALLILISKILIVAAMVRRRGIDSQVAWRTGLLLSVGGEFGLALIAISLDSKVIDGQLGQIAITSVLLSMIAGAILIRFNGSISALLIGKSRIEAQSRPEALDQSTQLVVIGGYGRVGHTIAVLLQSSGVPFIALDTDPEMVAQGRASGHLVSYGDISDPELLAAIRVERAALVVITVDSANTAFRAISHLRRTCPQVPVIARARDLESSTRLLDAGAVHAYPETIEASLRLGATALQLLHIPHDAIDDVIQDVRDWGYKPVLEEVQKK
jgi:CPA2 family monovalent cation:H+ antiporter-2